jgi:hypothetical protein
MVAELAKGDWLDLQAQGYNPTLEDFDRLNQLALKLMNGAETTTANFPRIGWAGDVPFYQPTMQVFAWYHTYAERSAANEETKSTLWAFALAHARTPHFFAGLTTPEEIDKAASAWVEKLPVTREEVFRACKYAAIGFDDAQAAERDGDVTHRANKEEAARNLANLEAKIVEACVALKVAPDAIMCETPSRLDLIRENAAVELGKVMKKDEALLHADYDLTLREIRQRLKNASKQNNDGEDTKDANAQT